jgi:hypothetical protein
VPLPPGDDLEWNDGLKLEAEDPLDPYTSETDTHSRRKYKRWYTLATGVYTKTS